MGGLFVLVVVAMLALAPTASASFPGANGKIAFDRGDEIDGHAVYTINPDGTGETEIFRSGSCGSDCSVWVDFYGGGRSVWSPAGDRLAFICEAWGPNYGGWTICLMNPDGSNVTVTPIDVGAPMTDVAWSPSGSRVAYVYVIESTECPRQSYFMEAQNIDGSAPGNWRAGIFEADWSPTEHRFAVMGGYVGCQGSPGRSYLAVDDGPVLERDHSPSWSPDGRKIAFVSGRDGNAEIYVMNADGSSQTRITTNAAADFEPIWSPDGRKIAFGSTRTPAGIWTMNADGTNPQFLSQGGGQKSWQPLRALDPYPRPASAGPIEIRLGPAYRQCNSPNSSHVAPLALPSCTPAVPESSLLTIGSSGQGGGGVLLKALRGNAATTADEADIEVTAQVSNVTCRAGGTPGCSTAGADYTGQLSLTLSAIKRTDRANGFGNVAATTQAAGFRLPVNCAATSSPSLGSSCMLNTTLDTVAPGYAPEGKRSIFAIPRAFVQDAGADGVVSGPGCPPTCGTGDEQIFLEGGLFLP